MIAHVVIGALAEEAAAVAKDKLVAENAAGGEVADVKEKSLGEDAAEEAAVPKKSLGEIAMNGFDTDKDGKISLHELLEKVQANQEVANHPEVQGWTQGFKEADKDKDMHLNAEELENLFISAKKQHKDELVQGIEESSKAILEGWDTDKDGKVSLLEFTEKMHNNPEAAMQPEFKGWHEGFKEADVDKDMHLNADELKSLLIRVVNDEHKDHPLHEDL